MMNKKHDCPIKQAIHECALEKMDDMRESVHFEGMTEEQLYECAWECSVEDHVSYVSSL